MRITPGLSSAEAAGSEVRPRVPEAFTEPVARPLEELVGRYARTHGPFTTADLNTRYAVDARGVRGE